MTRHILTATAFTAALVTSLAAGEPINVPMNYYPDDDPSLPPLNRWRSHAHLLYGNWISEIYLTVPYDVSQIGLTSSDLRD